MAAQEFVRYCLLNHAVRFSGLCPSTCPICGSKFDLTRPPVPVSELEKAEAAQKKTDTPEPGPVQSPVEPAVPAPAAPAPEPAALSRVQVEPTPAVRGPSIGKKPVPIDPFGARKPISFVRPASARPEEPGVEAPVDDSPKNTPVSVTRVLQLSYFGTPIAIPREGGWLGREGIGAEFLEGNNLVSRRHVFVKPDRNGRLILQDDRSLNGVFCDTGEGRRKLEKGSAVLLKPGDILWLYNVPLKVEEKYE